MGFVHRFAHPFSALYFLITFTITEMWNQTTCFSMLRVT
jgi:hypothetical protein